MPIVSLDQKNSRVQIGAFEVDNRILFEFFSRVAAADRDEQIHKALYIGVLENRGQSALFGAIKRAISVGWQISCGLPGKG
jgi:hypothetical protein